MLLTVEKVLVLKSVAMFAWIPEEALIDVAAAAEEVEYNAGAEIVRKGEMGTSMYVIVEGRVRVHDEGKLLGEMKAGEVFGELSALDPSPRSATVSAAEDTYVFKMGQEAIYELMSQHSSLAQGIIQVLCRRIRHCDNLLRSILPDDTKVSAGRVERAGSTPLTLRPSDPGAGLTAAVVAGSGPQPSSAPSRGSRT